ncbi:MAG: metallophosphoesterase, partial [Acidobacteria bacterium]|nr:metallophosphoesterase [Acidobacteriota bacterium]
SLLSDNVRYLQDETFEIDGLKIYGSPWQPRFYDWAFNLMRGRELREKWALIPDDVDVLVTHGPPQKILDAAPTAHGFSNEGCEELRKRVEELRGRLLLHVFGHIHCGYGVEELLGVKFVNASVCDELYQPVNAPVVVEL